MKKKTCFLALTLWSECYSYYLEYLEIAYFPVNNHILQNRYLPVYFLSISKLTNGNCYDFTGYSKHNLTLIMKHWRIPEIMSYPSKIRCTGESALLRYMYWTRKGGSKLLLMRIFGGDPRLFTYYIRLILNHFCKNFYHKISGQSMNIWLPYINNVR